MPAFDLNVESMLEHWALAHAVRELIANALDEAALTRTADPVTGKAGDGRRQAHKRLDVASLAAYSWPANIDHDELLVSVWN